MELDDEFIFVCALGRGESPCFSHIKSLTCHLAEPVPILANAGPVQGVVYVYHRNPHAETDPYSVITLNPAERSAYMPISYQSVLTDPSIVVHHPSFQVAIRDAKPLVPAEIRPFELTDPHRRSTPPFRPDFPVA